MDRKEWKWMAKAFLALSLLVLFSAVDAAVAQEKGKSVELRMATGAKPFQRFYKAAETWMNLVEKGTSGTVKIKPFPSAQLYDYHELGDPLMSGSIDLSLATPEPSANWRPAMPWTGLTGGAPTWKKAGRCCGDSTNTRTSWPRSTAGSGTGSETSLLCPQCRDAGPPPSQQAGSDDRGSEGATRLCSLAQCRRTHQGPGHVDGLRPDRRGLRCPRTRHLSGGPSLEELYLALKLYEKSKYLVDYTFNGGMMPFFISLKAWNRVSTETQKVMTDAAQQVQGEYFSTQVSSIRASRRDWRRNSRSSPWPRRNGHGGIRP